MSSETFNLEQSPNKNSQLIKPTEEKEEIFELDFSEGEVLPESETVTEVKGTDVNTETPVISTQETDGGLDFSEGEDITISNLEKLEYGWDKTTNVVGNVFRIGKAQVQDWIDPDKNFTDYILQNEKKRLQDIEEEHWKFTGNEKAQKSGLVTAGEILTYITDPYYIAGYYLGAAALTNPISSAGLNAALLAGDSAISQFAKTGKIDAKEVGKSAAIAGVIGGLFPVGAKVIKKLAPQATEKQVKLVSDWLDKKIAKRNNLSVPELKAIQTATASKGVQEVQKKITKWNVNFVAPIVNETKAFKAAEKVLLDKRNLLIKLRTARKGTKINKGKVPGLLPQKSAGKQITEIRQQIIDARNKSNEIKKVLFEKQQVKFNKWSELVASRDTKILEALKKSEGPIDKAVTALLSATVRPLVGAAGGTTLGILFGDEETDLLYWAAAGAVGGQMQKMIQRSKVFTGGEKGKILGLLDKNMASLTMQKVRSALSATSASKLNSYGGATEKISRMLLRDIDSSVQEKSAIAVSEQMERYFTQYANKIFKPYNADEISSAISINRGKKITKDTPENIVKLSKDIKSYLDEFKELTTSSGFFPKQEIADYFPRVLDWGKINSSPAEAKAFEKTLVDIYKSLKYKNPDKAAKNYIAGHKISGDSVFNREILVDIFGKQQRQKFFGQSPGATKDVLEKGSKNKFIYTPVTEHITHQRSLQGPYKLVEEILEKKGYLVNDGETILRNLINRSSKSIAFSRQFGTNGELLKPLFEQIKKKYNPDITGLSESSANKAAIQEANLVANTIDAYFDRYGKRVSSGWTGTASILATLSNMNMLGRVTISSLGDLIQPFQNSSQWKSIIKGFSDTSLRAKNEKGLAKNLGLDIDDNLSKALFKSAGMDKGDITMAASWMGENPTRKLNNLLFKGLGLEWLTGYARRFAYNVGVADSYYLSKQLSKVIKSKGIQSNSAQKIITFLKKGYNINSTQALQLAESNTLQKAITSSTNKKILNQSGIKTANRDALIPQVSNRLLFTQSNNPTVRVWGQFLSWAMAKSAQTNKIIQRVENGSAKQLIKMLAVIPIYSGVQSLRELAKHGEVVTDYDANNKKWWAEGTRLSGMFGWLPELVANRTIGPGSREPWYAFAPFLSTAKDIGEVGKKTVTGDFDKAGQIISERLAPLPNWRNLLGKILFSGSPKDANIGTSFGKQISAFSKGGRVKFNTGDNVNQKEIKENKKMNVKDTVKAAVVAGALTTGVNAEVNKAQDNFILPKEKPKVEVVQKEKTKDYSKLPALAEDKKKFLMDSASVIYQNNKGRDVPDDILLAIALEETGYGTSRFYREGNNYFNMVAEKGDDRIKAKGDNTQVAKFKQPSESLDKFYSWVDNKPHYKNVRATIEKYKAGEATKSDIIDEIAKTGWAENPNWSKNVKSILKARVNGKHSEELNNLKTSLFEEKE